MLGELRMLAAQIARVDESSSRLYAARMELIKRLRGRVTRGVIAEHAGVSGAMVTKVWGS